MRIGPPIQPVTAISASNAETIVVRGHDLAKDLIGKIGFTGMVWLLITGEMPDEKQRRILDGCLVAIAEHGLVPSVQASRMTLAAAPEALQGAVAAGILGCGSVILGSSEAAGIFFHEILDRAKTGGEEGAIRAVIQEYRAAKRAIPGYGHPQHSAGDPRALRLFEIAAGAGLASTFTSLARRVEILLPGVLNKPLRLNVSGAIPAVLLDAGFPLHALKGVPILARTASLIAHLLEEQLHPMGFELSYRAALGVQYTGSAPPGFQAAGE